MVGARQSNWYEVDGSLECWNVEQGNPAQSYRRLGWGIRLRVRSLALKYFRGVTRAGVW